ncbi:MAG: 2-C-methyl-D-erythritol 2,4-cyclodiphosphate synthase [Treponema sp.]|nr:2-C-methyl-D-erythritol 2,4-cyclodiphosphate synthase [Treponema sp.]
MMMNNNGRQSALVLVAGGSSSRMGGIKKEYLPLDGGTVLSSAAKVFLQTLPLNLIAVTYPSKTTPDELNASLNACRNAFYADSEIDSLIQEHKTKVIFVEGGSSRQKSVFNALNSIKIQMPANGIVLIHDGARPFVSPQIVTDVYNSTVEYGAAVPGLEPVDTQNIIDTDGFIRQHLVRAQLTAVQTPQGFLLDELFDAHRKALDSNKECTDDTEIWDLFVPGGKVKVVKGDSKNKKITYIQDIDSTKKENNKMIRCGLGYDKHILAEGRPLMLGGLNIPSDRGELGHSDGDALLHAITDALLGASGMGDIGSYFPPEEAEWKDADSKVLLKTVWKDIRNAGWSLENLDCVIALEKPKFLPHRQNVIQSIADVLGVDKSQVFVKAKTGEKTGDVGLGKVVEVWTTCLLSK